MSQISCEKCTSKLKECKDAVPFESKVLGNLLVPGVQHYKCPNCGSRLISYEGARTLFSYVKGKEAEAIKYLPVGDFITANEAAVIVGCSKQNFSKDPRVKRGMILCIEIEGGRHLYHKKSVELFSKTKDGRFLINTKEAPKIVYKEIYVLAADSKGKYERAPRPLKRSIYPNVWGEQLFPTPDKNVYCRVAQ